MGRNRNKPLKSGGAMLQPCCKEGFAAFREILQVFDIDG
jgi:hypothetical protein